MDEDQQPHHDPVPYSTPTCLQLGIPIASEPGLPGGYPDPRLPPDDVPGIPPMLESYLDPVYHDSYLSGRLPYLPFPSPYGLYDYGFEPAFIRKRNERERQRVKCVNEGYARLREHLPSDISDKRLSKVETLRAAIKYIKKLQKVLHEEEGGNHRTRIGIVDDKDSASPETNDLDARSPEQDSDDSENSKESR
ncbi:PREDICTED: achaete-scute homolog 5-like [Branchiostoma belcheri]|uniref:Achaete-scute homolog 5-like n=1 Tax=Branchiostoma belcheri TaxID=7741 RepID=A0A6P4Y8P8_BRABE|nr:PREDICTED: achaete-scute homolog 5-like [Branchiostoma belcheri]